jgi:hypothetical protein
MYWLRDSAIVALSITLLVPSTALASEAVGEAVQIRTEVSGESGPIAVDDSVHRDERIRTSTSGLGEFQFRDGTKLAVGWGSSVVVDKFVYDDSDNLKKFTIRAAKGTFRWISGNADHSAYQILTPAGTIGVRGTAFDFYVGANGTTAVVLLNGSAQFCGAGGCRQLKRQCDCVVANRNGNISDARRVTRDIFKTLGNPQALPFLSGNQSLTGRLGFVGAGGCGLSTAQKGQLNQGGRSNSASPDRSAPANPSAPSSPAAPAQQSAPAPQSAPDTPSLPNTPSTPNTPNTPSTPDAPSTPGKPDHPGKSDHDHHGWGHDWGGSWGGGWHSHDNDDHDGEGNGPGGGAGGYSRR